MPFQIRPGKAKDTDAFSNLRMLSILFVLFIILLGGITIFIVATQTNDNIIALTKNEMRSKAALVALEINGDTLQQIHAGDEETPSFIRVRDQLRSIRDSDPMIKYIYTMRQTASGIEFIVDGDYGFSDDAAAAGEVYPTDLQSLRDGFTAPSVDPEIMTDEWGSVLSGYAPVRNSRGEVVGLIGIDMDATSVIERISFLNRTYFLVGLLSVIIATVAIIIIENRKKRDQEVIAMNRDYLNQIFTSVRAGIMIIDEKTHQIQDVNPAALVMIGISKENLIGNVCHKFICPAEQGKCPITDLGLKVDNSERVLLNTRGERIPIIKTVDRVVLEGKPMLLETFFDISDRKNAEMNLLAANRKLKILSVVTRNDIISDIYALAGYIELMMQENPDLEKNPLKAKLVWVIDRIRSKSVFFRDYDEAGTTQPVWQDFHDVINSSVKQAAQTLAVRTDCPAGLEMFADPLFYKVFDSLFNNTNLHGKHATEVLVSCSEKEGNLVIRFEDNGVGIPRTEKKRIFERGIGSLTGLGLFLAREILCITGMAIEETGEPGKGARFEITVPSGYYRFSVEKKLDEPSGDGQPI